jgi:hypothetical protein
MPTALHHQTGMAECLRFLRCSPSTFQSGTPVFKVTARVQRDRHAHRAILLAALALLRRVMYALLMQRWCQQAYCICVLSADACVPWLCTLLLLVWSDAIRL